MYKTAVASALLDIRAVYLRPNQPFTWASGIASPIYCDNRLVLSDVASRNTVEEALCTLVREHFDCATFIAGTATAGIAHAAIIADKLGLPMGYVRGQAKEHGRQNRIEGRISAQDRVVVVEDLISTGASAIETAEACRQTGAQVLGIVSIFTYNMDKSKQRLREADLINYSATDLESVIDVALKRGLIDRAQSQALLVFRDNPNSEDWRKMF